MFMKYVPDTSNFGFMKLRFPSFAMSCIGIVLSIFLIMTQGLNLGIDFRGGSVIETTKPDNVQIEDVRAKLSGLNLGEVLINEARGTGVEDTTILVVRIATQDAPPDEIEAAQQAATELVKATLLEAYPATATSPGLEIKSSASIGPKVSGELFRTGITALIVALTLMLLYIAARFAWQFSLGAVAALTHDVILTIGVFSGLQLEFNLTTIAALLTIIGYSMNDTVVVFDRVREESRRYKQMPNRELVDFALNGTLSRTLLTSVTTLLALLAIFILGGPVLRGMSFALIWGVIVGTYSSIFVASSLLLALPDDWRHGKKKAEDVVGFQGAD